jgi:MFS family permease
MLILGLIGGVAADRFNRRKMLMLIQVWTLLMHIVMATLLLAGVIELWHVYVLAFGLGAGMAMNQPVRTSIIPNLVDKKDMINAMSLNSIAINSTRLGGPALIAILIAATDVGWAYVWSAGAFVVVIWTTTKIAIPEITSRRPRGNPVSQLMEGFVYIARHRVILALVMLGLGPLSIGFAHQVLLPQLVEQRYGYGIGLMGVLTSVGAVGGLTAGLFIASRQNVGYKGRLMLLSTLSYGLALLGFAGATYMWMAFPLIIWIGASQTLFRAGNSATLMEVTPDRLRGRIISATLLDTALSPAAGIAAGIVADRWGVSAGYALLSAGVLGVLALTMIIYPRIKDI